MTEEQKDASLAGAGRPGEMSGRDRLVAAVRRPGSRRQLTAAVLLAVVGFAAVVQVRANQQDNTYEGWRQDQLIQLLDSLDAASQRTETEIAQLQRTKSALENDTLSRQAALAQARQQVNVLGILAGTLPAVGPGIRVTIQDPHGRVTVDHLLNALEELRDAGAEAMEINDSVRVVAQTSLQDAPGGGILVDGRAISPPYTLDAIGDKETLAGALSFRGGFIDEVEDPTVGASVTVRQLNRVEVSTVVEPARPQYAEPAAGQ